MIDVMLYAAKRGDEEAGGGGGGGGREGGKERERRLICNEFCACFIVVEKINTPQNVRALKASTVVLGLSDELVNSSQYLPTYLLSCHSFMPISQLLLGTRLETCGDVDTPPPSASRPDIHSPTPHIPSNRRFMMACLLA